MTPAHAQHVVIHLPDARDLPARVDAADDHSVTLVLAVPPLEGVRATPAIVEWTTPTGIHRIAGALAPAPGDPALLRLDRDGEEVVQRRAWARVDAVIPVDVRFEDDQGTIAATVTLNVSGGGALIRDPVGLPLGAEVQLELQLDRRPIRAAGRVVRETEGGLKGIALEAVTAADRERIVRFVTARQLVELRMRRRLGPPR